MHRFARYASIASICALATAVGCTIKTETTKDNGGTSSGSGGTQPLPSTQATAMVTGHVDASVGANVRFAVNGVGRSVLLAPDQSFVVRDVPSGDVTFDCDADDVKGTLTISDVQPGESIEVSITRQGDAIVIVIVTRTTVSTPPVQVTTTDGDALEIDDDDVCYYLKPGVYHRDIVIKGNDVHLFGGSHGTCTVDDVSVVTGTLTIQGDHAQVLDVQIAGNLVITGHDDRVQDTCNSCFDEGCGHDCDETCQTVCDAGAPPANDAGAPMPDAAPPPPADDAGTMTDAAPPPPPAADAGPSPNDAGAPSADGSPAM